MQDCFKSCAAECAAVPETLAAFDQSYSSLESHFVPLTAALKTLKGLPAEKAQSLADTLAELRAARDLLLPRLMSWEVAV